MLAVQVHLALGLGQLAAGAVTLWTASVAAHAAIAACQQSTACKYWSRFAE